MMLARRESAPLPVSSIEKTRARRNRDWSLQKLPARCQGVVFPEGERRG